MQSLIRGIISLNIAVKLIGLSLVAVLAAAAVAFVVLQPSAPPVVAPGQIAGAKGVAPHTPVTLTFDKPMNHETVYRSFRLQPDVSGDFSWQGNTLSFVPENGWERKVTYRVSLTTDAMTVFGLPLLEPLAFSFTTADKFAVASVQPAPDATAVDADNTVLVQFSRPVVALATRDQQPPPLDLRLSPDLPGTGKWLTTSVYTFRPTSGFRPSTRYSVTVPAATSSVDGETLPSDFTWTFTTPLAAVAAVAPEDGSRYANPTGAVQVVFNQPMDPPSAAAAFSLVKRGDGTPIAGAISWSDDKTMLFRPAQALALAADYSATLRAGALAAGSNVGTAQDHTWTFATAGVPAVAGSTPVDGQQNLTEQRVVIRFSYPMDRDSTAAAVAVVPAATQVYSGWQDSDTSLVIWGTFEPSTRYTITVGGSANGRSGLPITAPYRFSFTMAPRPPSMRFIGADWNQVGTFNSYLPSEVNLSYVNVSRVDYALYRLDQDTLRRLLVDYRAWETYAAPAGNLIRRWSSGALPAEPNKEQFALTPLAQGNPLAPGLYYLEGISDKANKARLLLVSSRVGLSLKRGGRQSLVWAVDLKTGQPVPNRSISFLDRDGKVTAQGRTDPNGIFVGDTPDSTATSNQGANMIFASSGSGDDFALVASTWSPGRGIYEDGLYYVPSGLGWTAHVYTDRPVYRPGQKVYYKGFVRSDDDVRYSVPDQNTTISVTVRDPQGKQLDTPRLKLDEFGAFDGALSLADQAAVGNYFVELVLGDRHFGVSFLVAEYRKPEFEAQVSADRADYVDGDAAQVTVKANYYFGAPVANAKVRWRVIARDYLFRGEQSYEFVDFDLLQGHEQEGLRAEGQVATDANGEASFRVPVNLSKDPLSKVFTIEASVSDVNYQEVSARHDVIAHKGNLYLGLRPSRYVGTAGQPLAVDLLSLNKDSAPVANTSLDLSFYARRWYSVQEKQPDGTSFWTSKYEDTLLGRQNATTGGEGKAVATFTPPKSGVYRVAAIARDGRGNEVRSATSLYVAGPDYAPWRVENNDRIEVIPDKKEYAVGDTAKLLVAAPFDGALALVTGERGRVIDHRVVRLGTNSAVLEVPITADYVPNVFVGVMLSKGPTADNSLPQFKVGYASLAVSTASKKLTIAITTDKPRYVPGEEAVYRLKATDQSGKGVSAQLSLALVDAAVLALATDRGGDPHAAFYGPRALGVQTAAVLAMSIDRVNRDLGQGRKGVGDGPESPGELRAEFPDTAYWNASLLTDGNGDATVAIKLPDNLTTWRLRVAGLTRDTIAGSAHKDILVTKEVLLRPIAPRFFVAGDEARLEAIVQNFTEHPVDLEVSLTASGLQPDQGAAFPVQRVTLPSNGLQKVQWAAKVDLAARRSTLAFRATPLASAVPADAVQLELPVRPPATAEVVASSGEVRGSVSELVRVGSGASREQGELTIDTSPSLAAGMRYSVAYLDGFPYECTEQTVSRFLPRVVMQRAFGLLGLPDREGIAQRLPDLIARGLQRLYKDQHYDGGWGWWVADDSDPTITAYALYGLAEARRSGYTVDDNVLAKASGFLRAYLDRPADAAVPEDPNRRAFALFSLASVGRGDLGLTNAAFDRRATLGHYGKAFLALALHGLNDQGAEERVRTLVADLTGQAIISASAAHWEEDAEDYRAMNTNTRSTAIVLAALLKGTPDSPLVPDAVRWLMVARKEGHWETTQETAWSLLALTDYLAASGELSADYSYNISVNDRPLTQVKVDAANLEETKQLRVALQDLLAAADNKVTIARQRDASQTGLGKLYYTLGLRYFVPSDQVEPLSEGVAVLREYSRLGDDAGEPVDSVAAGDVLKVKLTIALAQDMHYFILEDPLPAGAEAVDTTLKTTSIAAQKEQGLLVAEPDPKKGEPAKGEQPKPGAKDPRRWYIGDPSVHDDRVALFATFLPKGAYEYTYLIRATTPGVYQSLPARAYQMYFPEVWGRSAGAKLTVK